MRTAAAGAGLSRSGVLRLQADWNRSGCGEPPLSPGVRGQLRKGEEPSQGRLARFQKAFAALSHGGGALPAYQVRALLGSMQVPLDASESKSLAQVFAAPSELVPYDRALAIYLELSAGPAGTLEARAAVESAIHSFLLEQEESDSALAALNVRPAGGWSAPATPPPDDDPVGRQVVRGLLAGTLRELVAEEDVQDCRLAERVRPGGGGWSPFPFGAESPEPRETPRTQQLATTPRRALPPPLRAEKVARHALLSGASPTARFRPGQRSPLGLAGSTSMQPGSPRLG